MPAYILNWNPANWSWHDLGQTISRVRRGGTIEDQWSSGKTKRLPLGSRVFLLKQGLEPKGIMASGWTCSEPYEGSHWDETRSRQGDKAYFIKFAYDAVLDPNRETLLDPRGFTEGPVRDVHWAPQASGTSIPDLAAAQLEMLWSQHIRSEHQIGHADQEISVLEGIIQTRLIRHRSRERSLRNAKVQSALVRGSLRCEVPGCGFDFELKYGPIGHGYAQVHHLKPLGSLNEPTRMSLDDLAVVCANCHAMIHLGGESRPLAGLIAGH